MNKIKKIAIIGTGVIGAGWIIRCLAHDKIVYAFDKDLKLKKNLVSEIKRTWPYVKKLFNKKTLKLKNFKYFTSLEEAVKDADFIQECASENYALKTRLMATIGKYAKPKAIISSSSSGLLPTKIYSKCKRLLSKTDKRVDKNCKYLLTLVCGGSTEFTKSQDFIESYFYTISILR